MTRFVFQYGNSHDQVALIGSQIEEWWNKISTGDDLSGERNLFVLFQLFDIFTKVNGRQDPLFWAEGGLS